MKLSFARDNNSYRYHGKTGMLLYIVRRRRRCGKKDRHIPIFAGEKFRGSFNLLIYIILFIEHGIKAGHP